ncbi:unnamed protein product [Darwinula stevensoni]|uniref:Uncharacterized protein n=1 Tax=Darwinula stevensoni TaxID=69355 RepID=A0A7R9A6H0_9CRUS|nr:unnamed protein product [Darwinula stevensoni]CAG0889144.1 unnamed protein product [Darwinula stevensoni]
MDGAEANPPDEDLEDPPGQQHQQRFRSRTFFVTTLRYKISDLHTLADGKATKESIIEQLHRECQEVPPGAGLSLSLRNQLETYSKEVRRAMVSVVGSDGCAPLFIACRRGNLMIVDYLIDTCNADLEQKGSYKVPDDQSVHEVTPLWCAAVTGNLNVVKRLIKAGADINAVSDSGSTPVRSACFMTHHDVVEYLVKSGADIHRPNYNGGTCLINAVQSAPLCRLLLQSGARVNAQDIQLKTALHYAIQEHRLDSVKVLLRYGADPMLRSRHGDDALHTACLHGSVEVLDFLTQHVKYPAERVIEAYELMGCTYMDGFRDLPLAVSFWKKALSLRASNSIEKSLSPSLEAFGHVREFASLEELESAAHDIDLLRMMSVVMSERILGPYHKDLLFRLMYRGAAFADAGQPHLCIRLWTEALKRRISHDTILYTETYFAAQALTRLFLDLYTERNLASTQVMKVLDLLIESIPGAMLLLSPAPVFRKQTDCFDRILRIIVHLLHILIAVQTDEKDLVVRIRHLLQLNPTSSQGDTLLHMSAASSSFRPPNFFDENQFRIFPNKPVTEWLLKCGANSNAINLHLSTPLHYASMPHNYSPEILECLLSYGAHLDQRNADLKTPWEYLVKNPDCPSHIFTPLSLKCLSAQSIIQHNLSFRGNIPQSLEYFVSIH